jgi:hypothetical protein
MKTKATTNKPGERGAPTPPVTSVEAGRSAKRKKGLGGRRKRLIRLNSDKEIKVNSFDFLWPGFAG